MKHLLWLLLGISVFSIAFFIAFSSGSDPEAEAASDPFEVQVPLSDGTGHGSSINRAKKIIEKYSIADQNIKEIEDYLNEVENYEKQLEEIENF